MDVWGLVASGSDNLLHVPDGTCGSLVAGAAPCLQPALVLPMCGLVLSQGLSPRTSGSCRRPRRFEDTSAWSLRAPVECGQPTPITSSEKFGVVVLTGNHMIWSLFLRPASLIFNWIRKGGRASTDTVCGCVVTECWVLPPDECASLWKGRSKFIFVEAPTAREDQAFTAPASLQSMLSHWSTSGRVIGFRHGAYRGTPLAWHLCGVFCLPSMVACHGKTRASPQRRRSSGQADS